jgi:hypothetical protein
MAREYLRLLEHAAAGEVEVDVVRFPFDRLGEAWQAQAEGAGGKVVVEF